MDRLLHPRHRSPALSGGEQRLLRIAASIGSDDATINLGDCLTGLDRPTLHLVLAAVAHAAGGHEHREVTRHPDGTITVSTPGSPHPWATTPMNPGSTPAESPDGRCDHSTGPEHHPGPRHRHGQEGHRGHLAGEQDLRIDTHGSSADRGGHIAVAGDSLLVYLHDRKAVKVYAEAWIDAWYIASPSTFPRTRGPIPNRS